MDTYGYYMYSLKIHLGFEVRGGVLEVIPKAGGRRRSGFYPYPKLNVACVSRECPANSETVWCNTGKSDCLGLNSQLYHLLAVWS